MSNNGKYINTSWGVKLLLPPPPLHKQHQNAYKHAAQKLGNLNLNFYPHPISRYQIVKNNYNYKNDILKLYARRNNNAEHNKILKKIRERIDSFTG